MTYIAGSLLVHAGLIRREQLVEAETLRQRDGGTLGECLARLGVVTEEQLVEFYHRRLMVPRIRDQQLEQVPPAVLALLQKDMAVEFRVLPVEVDAEGAILLAMADPSDTHAVDELAFFTDRFIQRGIAQETALRRAIERHYGVRFESPPAEARVELLGPPRRKDRQAASRKRVETPEPVLLLTRVKHPGDVTPLPAPLPMASDALPAPTPSEPTAVAPAEEPIPLTRRKVLGHKRRRTTLSGFPSVSPAPPVASLRAAAERDEVGRALLDYVATLAPRAALFVIRRGEIVGHDGRGEGLGGEATRAIALPSDGSSLFSDVIRSRLPYRGPLPASPSNRRIAQLLRHTPSRDAEVLVLPVSVRDRVAVLVWADGFAGPLPDEALHAASREAGAAYERLLDARPLGS